MHAQTEAQMNDRAGEFLRGWFAQHIRALPPVQRLAEAVRLATGCRKDAVAAGIDLQDIRDAADGDLIRNILQALDAAARLAEEAPLAPEQMSETTETTSS
jgi:hypothetical protein